MGRRLMLAGSVLVLAITFALGSTVLGPQSQSRALTPDPDLALFDPDRGEWHLRYPDGSIDTFFYGIP